MGYHVAVNAPDARFRGHYSRTVGELAQTAVVFADTRVALEEHADLNADLGWTLDAVVEPSDKWSAVVSDDAGLVLAELDAGSEDDLFAQASAAAAVEPEE